ncbi:MAG: MarR family transcriptional regulator [Chloroflexi bacterium]|nr:MarR family transcriptional regulator [Chloroflexota bacterium]
MPSDGAAQETQELRAMLHEVLGQLLQSSMHVFWQRVREQGLSMTQVFALRYIHRQGECNISDLAKALGVSNAAASQMLDRLVQQGYVLRQENPRDRRNKRLSLTEEGQQVLAEITPSRQAMFDEVTKMLSPQETALVTEALNLLLTKMRSSESFSTPSHFEKS